MNLWKLHAKKPLILDESFMQIWRQGSKSLLDEKELVEFIFSWEERVPIDEFTHDACYCPYVDLLSIVSSHQQLRRPIPPGGHVVGEAFLFLFQLPGEPEVTDFESVVLPYQEILGLDVAMDDVLGVEVGESFEELIDEAADEG